MYLVSCVGDFVFVVVLYVDEWDVGYDLLLVDDVVNMLVFNYDVFVILLCGLEWNEVMLVINSFEVVVLCCMYCLFKDLLEEVGVIYYGYVM